MFKPAARDPNACPSKAELRAYAANRLAGSKNEGVLQHLKLCSECLRELAKLTKFPSPEELAGKRLPWWRRLFRNAS